MKVLDLMVDFIKMSKVWSLCMEFYGAWQEIAMHHNLANGKSQNVHTAELGYLGFQDYLNKFAAL